MQEETIY